MGDTLIVGAGAGGLAVAGALARRGISYSIIERAEAIGSAWRGRYDSLRLHTGRAFSGLPGAPIPRRFGQWVSRDDLVGYLESYAAQRGIRPEFGVELTRLEQTDSGWRAYTRRVGGPSAADGPSQAAGAFDGDEAAASTASVREARRVVLATGYTRTPLLPDWAGRDEFGGDLIHSSAYREPSPYAGRTVLVVGSGNSAAEIAVELTEVARKVLLAVRTPPNIQRRDIAGVPIQLVAIATKHVPERLMNPMSALLRRISVPDLSAQGLPRPTAAGFSQFVRSRVVPILDHGFVDAVRDGRISIVAAVEGFAGDDVLLADGRRVAVDAVIAATGYRPDLAGILDRLDLLDPFGAPVRHGGQTDPSAPGLYFVGVSVVLAGQLREIGLEAESVAAVIATG